MAAGGGGTALLFSSSSTPPGRTTAGGCPVATTPSPKSAPASIQALTMAITLGANGPPLSGGGIKSS